MINVTLQVLFFSLARYMIPYSFRIQRLQALGPWSDNFDYESQNGENLWFLSVPSRFVYHSTQKTLHDVLCISTATLPNHVSRLCRSKISSLSSFLLNEGLARVFFQFLTEYFLRRKKITFKKNISRNDVSWFRHTGPPHLTARTAASAWRVKTPSLMWVCNTDILRDRIVASRR